MSAAAAALATNDELTLFGLTGGIASGKSFVTTLLRKACIPVIDADVITHDLQRPGFPALNLLAAEFGEDIIVDGALDRNKLGEIVFGHEDKLLKLALVMQPLIAQEVQYQLKLHLSCGCRLICYDAALIIELGQAEKFRPLVLVACQPATQMARMLKRGLTNEQARARIASQLSVSEKEAVADVVIRTDGTKDETREQVEALIASFDA